MAETVETTTEAVVETTTVPAPQSPVSKTLDELKAENERLQSALKERNKEEAARRKKLEALEKAEEERKNAELTEQQRLQKEVETLRSQAESANRALLQRSVADEIGLLPVFAARIQGKTREEMVADAQAMRDALPRATAPTGTPTNPGSGATRGETDEEKRKRLGLR